MRKVRSSKITYVYNIFIKFYEDKKKIMRENKMQNGCEVIKSMEKIKKI